MHFLLAEREQEMWSDGDKILKSSLLWVGHELSETYGYYENKTTGQILEEMERDCRLRNFFGHRKSPTYKWSNSGSENLNENTIWKRPTYWVYHNILRYVGIDLYKGANCDQLRAYWLTLYLRRERWIAIKHLLGYVVRLGFSPSLMENIILKPQSLAVLLATIWKPMHYIVLPFLLLSRWRNFKKPISQSTTNKITLIPTLALLGYRYFPKKTAENHPEIHSPVSAEIHFENSYKNTKNPRKTPRMHIAKNPSTYTVWITKVYETYFCEAGNSQISIALIAGILKLDLKIKEKKRKEVFNKYLIKNLRKYKKEYKTKNLKS